MERKKATPTGELPEANPTPTQETIRPELTRAEQRLARGALFDSLWSNVLKGILADAKAKEQATNDEQPK